MSDKQLETMNQKKLILTIKESNDSWALLTANGFNLACEVSTDYPSLCKSLVESFSEELTAEEKAQFNKELEDKEYNFEAWLNDKKQEEYLDKIAIKSVHRQWLIEFVKACSQDHGQYILSQGLNDFLDMFHHLITLNVDPYFYRRCLSRKEKIDPPLEEKSDAEVVTKTTKATTAKTTVVNKTVFLGLTADSVKEVEASRYLKKNAQKEFGLLPEENVKSKEINDGFSTRGNMENKKVVLGEHNLFYLHGACHLKIIDGSNSSKIMKKLKADDERSLISAIRSEEPETNSAIFAGASNEKMNKINANSYLKSQFEAFKELQCKNIVIYGASLADNDEHIWIAIKENTNIENIYVSYYGNTLEAIQQQSLKFFSAKNVLLFESEQFIASS